jgi:hypothetical protein
VALRQLPSAPAPTAHLLHSLATIKACLYDHVLLITGVQALVAWAASQARGSGVKARSEADAALQWLRRTTTTSATATAAATQAKSLPQQHHASRSAGPVSTAGEVPPRLRFNDHATIFQVSAVKGSRQARCHSCEQQRHMVA